MLRRIKRWLTGSKPVLRAEDCNIRNRHHFIMELAYGYARWDGVNKEYADAYRLLLHTFTAKENE